MLTALGSFPAVQFIGLVPTLRLPITNLGHRDAHLPVGALKLIWGGVQNFLNFLESYHGQKTFTFRVYMIP